MTRTVIYARYSTELQRAASIEDQVRLCKERIAREGWTLTATYSDRAMSGASALRPGYQKLLEDARNGGFDVLVAEAMDRLSRDQEDIAALYKRLRFSGIRIVTLAEGEVSELHVGLKGTMNAVFLKDLAQKTWRGLEGRVRAGRSGGGISYGYDMVREVAPDGTFTPGLRKINAEEAGIVRRIFSDFAAGKSPRAIAQALNAATIAGPQGRAWGPSTIYGNWRRGTGILNNELYAGRLIWNRQRFEKDPESGKRVARPNPPERWVIQEVPELRIIEEGLWQEVKQRQGAIRKILIHDGRGVRSERARRPPHLLSGLLKCGACGGGFSMISATHYGCSQARDRGTCRNRLTIRRDHLETQVLNGLKSHLMQPELVTEFVEAYHRALDDLARGRNAERQRLVKEQETIGRDIARIIDAIKQGLFSPSLQQALTELEQRKAALSAELTQPAPPPVRLHPNLSAVYRAKVENLREALNAEDTRAEAAQILRRLISAIRLVPEEEKLRLHLCGDLAGILALAAGNKKPGPMAGTGSIAPVQATLVAGRRNQRDPKYRLWV